MAELGEVAGRDGRGLLLVDRKSDSATRLDRPDPGKLGSDLVEEADDLRVFGMRRGEDDADGLKRGEDCA